ncbi:MAG: type II toxin-antitoxin system VapC family toxin [candidate division Zixibacteria bacterium]|nr:type II toxin-antitoxin system VapC family toxin [candidate division Zixibacteria bacterium]
MIVFDTSIYIDALIPAIENRNVHAREIIKITTNRGFEIFEPRTFIVELVGVLSRFKRRGEVKSVLDILNFVNIISENEIFEVALDIAFETHCRAIDSYFIATSELTNSILISNDRIMVNNAKKYGLKAYYLIDEVEKVLMELR